MSPLASAAGMAGGSGNVSHRFGAAATAPPSPHTIAIATKIRTQPAYPPVDTARMNRIAIASLLLIACGSGATGGAAVDAGEIGWTACAMHWIESGGEAVQTRTFDAQGRWVHDTWAWTGQPVDTIDDYAWDDDRLIESRVSDPNGALRVHEWFHYDGAHRLIGYQRDGSDVSPVYPADGVIDYAEEYGYDDHDQWVRVRFDDNGDGVLELAHQEVITWDARGCLATDTTHHADGVTMDVATWTDRAADCQPTRIDYDDGADGTIDTSARFEYDAAGRLTAYHGVDNDNRAYSYDPLGRIAEIVRTDSTQRFDYCPMTSGSPNAPNSVASNVVISWTRPSGRARMTSSFIARNAVSPGRRR
jgi:YD repeat-containing protein